MSHRVSLLLAAALLAGSTGNAAGEDGPLIQQRGHHPLNAAFGLPTVASRPVGTHEWQVAVEHANSFMGGVRGGEVLFLDGESTELAIRHRRRLDRCWQGEASLPFVAHTTGWADRVIDDWHQTFGLPDAERDTFPLFDLNYVWRDAEDRRREIVEPAAGVGDVQLAVQRSLGCRRGRGEPSASDGAIARVGIKLPTGDSERLLGSGATDVYADLQSPVWSFGRRWRGAMALGTLVPGDSDLFADQRPLVFYGTLGTEFALHPRLRALAQIDWHTPFHDSALRELGDPAVSLGVGLRYAAGPRGRFELTIGEDAVIDSVPDIVGRLAWTWTAAPRPPRGGLPPGAVPDGERGRP